MPVLNMAFVMDKIAGPETVRRAQENASARSFAGNEERMKAIQDVSPECMPGVYGTANHRADSVYSSQLPSPSSSIAPSRASSRERLTCVPPTMRPTAHLQRSQSDVPVMTPREGPPDITAMKLSSHQIKKTYSSGTLVGWNPAEFPLVPLTTQQGFGRYRSAQDASPEFLKAHMKKQVKDLEHLESLTQDLEMADFTGSPNGDYHDATASGYRRSTRHSPRTALFTEIDESAEYVESGTRVVRGFSPAGIKRRSPRDVMMHERKGSNLSTVSLSSEIDSPPFSSPLKRTTTLQSERRHSVPLSTIDESQTDATSGIHVGYKKQKACEFTDDGNQDSAVASDIEEDEDWADCSETNPSKVSTITQMVKADKEVGPQPLQAGLARVRTKSTDKKRGRGSAVTLDRNRTIRARPDLKRMQSKNKIVHTRGKSDGKTQAEQPDSEAALPQDTSPESIGLCMVMPTKHQPVEGRTQRG